MKARTRAVGPVALLVLALVSGCSRQVDPWEGKPSPRVLSSFPPIHCFARNVAVKKDSTQCLCPPRIDPHNYVYNINDTIKVSTADLFLANGFGLDTDFTDKLYANTGKGGLKLVYKKLAEGLPVTLRRPARDDKKDSDHGDHSRSEFDPHVWLGIPQAQHMVDQIRDELKKLDPENAPGYDRNAASYKARLQALQDEGKKALAGMKIAILTHHDSMRYFADSFGIPRGGFIQEAPRVDPSGKELAELAAELARKYPRLILAVEPGTPGGSAEILKKELSKAGVKVETVTLDPLEICEQADWTDDGWYERKMRENIRALVEARKKLEK
jgi:zinc/manganese transport system substrate-binding protein